MFYWELNFDGVLSALLAMLIAARFIPRRLSPSRGVYAVSSIVGLLWHPPQEGIPDWKYLTGIVLAAVGAAMVLYSKSELDMRKPKTDTPAHTQAMARENVVGI